MNSARDQIAGLSNPAAGPPPVSTTTPQASSSTNLRSRVAWDGPLHPAGITLPLVPQQARHLPTSWNTVSLSHHQNHSPPLQDELSNRSQVCGFGFRWGIITISKRPYAVRPSPGGSRTVDAERPLRVPGYIVHRCSVVQHAGCFRSPVHPRPFRRLVFTSIRLFGTSVFASTQTRRPCATATSNIPSESHYTTPVDAGHLLE